MTESSDIYALTKHFPGTSQRLLHSNVHNRVYNLESQVGELQQTIAVLAHTNQDLIGPQKLQEIVSSLWGERENYLEELTNTKLNAITKNYHRLLTQIEEVQDRLDAQLNELFRSLSLSLPSFSLSFFTCSLRAHGSHKKRGS